MNNIVRDCGEIWTRLFDHRPFIGGEVIYFQEEFEGKRGEREITSLFQVLESVTDLRDSHADKLHSLSNSLPDLEGKLERALAGCKDILGSEGKYNVDANLEVKREIRQSEWEKFETDIKANRSNINNKFDEKEEELRQFYVDLEKKLHIEEPPKSL